MTAGDGAPPPRGFVRRSSRVVRTAGGQFARHAAVVARRPDQQVVTESHRRAARSAAELLGSMKGGAMKLGQLASFVDLAFIPEPYRELWQSELAVLRDAVAPVDTAAIRRVLRERWGDDPERVLARFDPEPVAAASIGQVHRGRTKDGREVAIKVQYPDIARAVRTDLGTAMVLLRLTKPIAPRFDARAAAGELRDRILEELDYEQEADNQRAFARMYRGHPFIHIPEVLTALSAPDVLVADWVDGLPFEEIRAHADQATRNRYGEILVRFYFGSPDLFGRFHADPHPGNHRLMPDGRVAFLDFGAIKELPEWYRQAQIRCALAFVNGDRDGVRRGLVELKLVDADAPADPDALYRAAAANMCWLREDEVTRVDADLVRRAIEGALADPDVVAAVRQTNIPPEEIWFRRMDLSVVAVLAQLEAEANWQRIAMEHWTGGPPATPLGEEHARWLEDRA